MAVDGFLGTGPSRKVDPNKSKEACTQELNGSYLMQKEPNDFIYMVLSAQTKKSVK